MNETKIVKTEYRVIAFNQFGKPLFNYGYGLTAQSKEDALKIFDDILNDRDKMRIIAKMEVIKEKIDINGNSRCEILKTLQRYYHY